MVLLVLIFAYSGIHLISGKGSGRQKDNVDKNNFNRYDNDEHQINQNWIWKKKWRNEGDDNETIAKFTENDKLKMRLMENIWHKFSAKLFQ